MRPSQAGVDRRRDLFLLAIGAGVLALLGELARVAIKGADYVMTPLNDAHYYRAMARHLWTAPQDLMSELAQLGWTVPAQQISSAYSRVGEQWLDPANGLSHQPPFAYRVLQPSLAGLLQSAGLSAWSAELAIYIAAAVMLAVFTYRLVAGTSPARFIPLIVGAGAVVAAIATTSPTYPDMAYLGLSVMAVWAARNGRGWTFLVSACLAAATRETALVLVVVWLAYEWGRRGLSPRLLFALAPGITYASVRLAVDVPRPTVSYPGLAEYLLTADRVALSLLAIAVCLAVSPLPLRTLLRRTPQPLAQQWRPEVVIVVVGALWALASVAVATNVTRMALLSLPYLIAASGWEGARTRWWSVSAGSALLGYALADTVATRGDARFGSWPWLAVAAGAWAFQIAALIRDSKDPSHGERLRSDVSG